MQQPRKTPAESRLTDGGHVVFVAHAESTADLKFLATKHLCCVDFKTYTATTA